MKVHLSPSQPAPASRCRRAPAFAILLFCLLAAAPGSAVTLESKQVRFAFDEAGGFALTDLAHRGRKVSFVGDGAGPLWRLAFAGAGGPEVRVAADAPAERAAAPRPGGLTLRWSGIQAGQGTARVTVSISLAPEARLSEWRIAVAWTDPKLALRGVEFPRIAGIRKVAEDDALTLPIYWGRLAKDPLRRLPRTSITYPVPGSMQYVSYYGGGAGLYLAAGDPDCWMKQFLWQADTKRAAGDLSLQSIPPSPLPTPGQWEIPYPVVVGVFDGDWNDSAQLYRAWALRQPWCAEGPVASRKTIPAWFKDVALWLKYYSEPGKVLSELADHQEYLRVPMAVHYYRYPVARFDDNYPEMLPAKPGYLQGVRDMQALGAHVIPYTQGSVWDMDTESWRLEGGAAAAAKSESGAFYEWPIAENTFAWMCPYIKTWQGKVADFVSKQVWDYGLDGVYLDVLSAGEAHACYDKAHGHPLHGGTYWGAGNRVLMQRLRERIRARKPEAVFTTEEICEAYVDRFDGFLTLDATRGGYTGVVDLCPLFTAVYHDYAIQYGSDCALGTNTDEFCALLAEHLVWGAKPTLSEAAPPRIREKPEGAAYLREATRCYDAAHPYLLAGKWLRPPALDVPTRAIQRGSKREITVNLPAVRHSLWQAPDGSIGLLLTNWTGDEQELSLRLDPAALGLPPGPLRLRKLWPAEGGPALPGSLGAGILVTVPLAPRSVLFYTLSGSAAGPAKPPAEGDFPFIVLRKGKDGAFPPAKVAPGTLWYAEGADLSIAADGTLAATGTRADQDFLLARRHPARLEPPTVVRVADAASGGLTLEVDGEKPVGIAGAGGLQVVARGTAGRPLALAPGQGAARVMPAGAKTRILLPLRPIPGLAPAPQTHRYDPAQLAALSRGVAERCRKLNASGAALPETAGAERMRAAVSAAAAAQTGARVRLVVPPGIRLLPFVPCRVSVESTSGLVGRSRLSVARAAHPDALAIRALPGEGGPIASYEVLVKDRRPVEHTVALLAEADFRAEGQIFTLADLVTLPCDMPLLVALDERKRILVAGRSAPVAVGLRNVAPQEVEARSRPLLPPGWTCDPAEPAPVKLGPAGLEPAYGTVRFSLTAPQDARPGQLLIPVETTYAVVAGSAVISQFACDILPRLVPLAEGSPAFTPTEKPARIRRRGRALLHAEAGESISLKISNVRVTTYADTAGYRLLDLDLKELAKGPVKVGEAAEVTAKATVSGTYFLEVEPKGGSCTVESANRCLVLEASPAEPLNVIFQMPVAYLYVPANARRFSLHVQCGGETEPVELALYDPAGREVLKESGALMGRELRVDVPEDGRGKVWKLVMSPREDVTLSLTGDVVPFLADHPARLLR